MKSFPFYRQLDAMDCGPTCLRMVAAHYGRTYSLQYLRERCHISREGVSLLGISEAAEQIGFQTMALKVPFEGEEAGLVDAPLPCIAHWKQRHFVVVYKVTRRYIWIADPGEGKFKLTRSAFEDGWLSDGKKGVLLVLEPGPDFQQLEGEGHQTRGLGDLFGYLGQFRRQFALLLLGMLLASLFQLIFPFLTQSIVDVGIQNQDIGFIYLILIAQLILFSSQTLVNFVQNWILLFIGTRMNVMLVTDFLIKLMRLPLGFFDAKTAGDLMQRVNDQKRIESFLTNSSLQIGIAVINIVVFGIVLLMYNSLIFLIFALASLLYVGWIVLFLRKRKEVDYLAFQQMSENQSSLIELIQGMQEIKLQGSDKKRRWQWATIQARLFRVNMRSLAISQYQDAGGNFINQVKNILISFVAAKAVIDGQMTLGMMMAAQYIVGQINVPLIQLIGFIRSLQDARISLERLNEVYRMEEEETGTSLAHVPSDGDIVLENLSFRYNALDEEVLKDINLVIPRGKVTAIVGTSGSGKTTLVKLLLGFYRPQKGHLMIGGFHLDAIQKRIWRKQCGAVMQDGYLFSDTIANNIAESSDRVVIERLLWSVKVANIRDFIEALPLGYNTMIGSKGSGISQGQRQRLLIARAVYKNPEFIFLDEATNALDTTNERTILNHLQEFFAGKTVVVVAHRLSTVRHADQIVVLEKGKLVELGSHTELVDKRGTYYHLVKNQLELGN
ncbi:MAG: peptidase domain-containing ABC transporter [Saprospiraceae bacterium]